MNSKQANTQQPSRAAKIPIAVVGIGCRMPGGVDSPKAFWDAVVQGEDMISEVPSDRWSLESFHDPDQTNHSKMVTKRCGFIKDIDKFDNTFFKISPREASSMDPQQRHILEVTYEAFEDAGIIPSTLGETCGVYIGVGMMDYPIMIMETSLINPYTHTGVGHSAVANRISYAFDLRGPSYVVDTACASSMTAMHVACNAIWDGECTSAVAGGCNTLLLPEVTVGFSALGVLSPEGKCCPFSDTAKGYVRSEGFGAFILKPLDAALAENDHVYAVIRGSAIAANGFSKSLTMPSAPAQEMVMKNAYERCGVPLSSVQYVEAHGTGTPVGDPIEAGAIGRTFGHLKDSPVKIGSVKSNFGHSECAAGITAAIKVALMLEKKMLVPTINYNEPNPNIDLQELNLKVQTTLEPMQSTNDETDTDKYTIGLNSFGFAGAVAHMIFQNAPKPTTNAIVAETAGWKFGDDKNAGRPIVLPLSAKSGDALKDLTKKWLDFNCDTDALHVASWQATRREHHPYRMAIIANSSSSCRQTLEGFLEGAGSEAAVTGTAPQGKPKVCFVFPGQGQQWVDMGRKLYSSESVFRETIDSCDKIFQRMSGWSLLEHCGLFNEEGSITDSSPYTSVEEALGQVEVIQPAIMFIQVALFHQWQHWGVQPDVVVGHSLGEISAAYACGGLTLEEAVAVIYHRSHAQAKQEGTGRMAALRATREQAEKMCLEHEHLYIAAVNAPGAITLAGNCEVVATVVEQNPGKAKQLRVTCAFHTPEMDPIKEPFSTAMEGVVKSAVGKRTVPFYSTVTGDYYDASFGTDYWWSNIRNAVLFQPAIEAILQETKADVFLEIAASNTLLSSVKQIARGLDPKHPPTTINSSLRDKDDLHSIQRAIGTLYTSGVALDWSCLTHETAEWAPVPTYPWQHQTFWLETEERQKRRLGLDDRTFKGQSGNLTLEMFPFLADHVVGNRVVFPGAGYIEHMIQMTFSETETPALKNINFIRVLPWPEESDSKKCTLKLGLEKDGAVMQVTSEGNEHSNGQTSTSSKEKNNCLPLEKITERCSTEVTSEVFYERLQDVGLSYGPAFQMVEKMFLGDGEALAILHPVPDNKQRIQIAHLDATFQLVLSAVGSSSAMYLPVHIDSLEMSTESIPSGEKLLAYTRIIDCDSMLLSADITIATENGECLASVKGFQAQNFNGNQSDVPIESCIYTTQWQPVSANTLPTSVVTEVFKESNLREKYGDELNAINRAEDVLDDIEGVCVSYIRHAIDTVPLEERAQGKSYTKYMDRFQTIAESKSSKSIPFNDIPSVLDKILEHVPELDSEVSLIKSLGDVLPDTLRDPQTAVPIMFCAEGLDRYFYDSLSTRLYYKAGAEAVVSAIREAAKHKKVVRVLELGARIGGLTRFIADQLKDLGEEKRMEYVFTDVTATFFQQAQENLKEFPFIQYKQIDIESDIDEQGFVPGSFDVIVCLDTLHAAVNVQRSTAYMSNLVSPDGLMFIIEGTNTHYLTELWFGALDVCWAFDDFRKERCWMDRQGWLDTMTQVGLKDIQSASSPNEFFHCVFAGRKSSLSERDCLREVIKQDKMIIVRDESNRFSSEFLPFYHGEVHISTFSESKSLDRLFSEHSDSPMEVIYIYSDEDSKAVALLRLFQAVESYPEAVKRVWILTKGANMDCTRPSGSLAVGLTRAVSNQIPGMSICSVDFDPENSLAENVQELLRLMDDSSLAEREIVLRKGRYVPRVVHQDLNNIKSINSKMWRVEQDLKGKAGKGASIDDLAFHDVQEIEVPSGHVKIKVKAAPLNFKDVMMALGLLEGLENDTHPSFGIECSGVVVEIGSRVSGLRIGDEVIAFGKSCFASHAICDAKLTVHKPDNLDFLESSSIGVVFVTAYLSLIERANLKKDETVLIHSACGGVGLAAIQIAQMIGAKIICTAGTEEKRSYLRKHVGIEMVSDSRTDRFHVDVMEWTNGRGVDVILNSLSGKLLQTGISLLGQGGRFCEIGKRDILQSSNIPMGFFLENKSFNSCQVDVLMRQRPATVQGIMRKVVKLFDNNKLKPIPTTVQPLGNLKETFRMMSKGAHIGKIVFEVPEGFQPAEIKLPLSQFKSNATYIVTGGFGGIGQALSRWLCQNGAKHIVLVSRKGAKTAAAKRTVSYLKRNKVNLKEYSLDISNRQSVNKMLENLRDDKRTPAIKGVFHLAGVIEEENLPDVTADQMNRILGAKATGAKILHDLTKDDQLDVFFMLSSISTTWGHPAQPCYCAANAYLDALAEKRHIDGLPALSVQLAPVKGAGYLEDKGQTVKVLAMKGNHQLYVDEFLQVLGQLLSRGDLPTVCLANQEWGATQQFCYKSMLKFHHLAALSNKSSASDVSSMDIADLETSIKSKMADLLCMSDDAIDVSQPMVNYGVDSLVALEMVNWATNQLGVTISQLDILGGITTAALLEKATEAR
ncbi:phenolphthiocerol synthesis polyketide synthase type I Pks15/1-like [Asterias rubens]|uniref:phenolphthiocerol synthesis polyketide synthase type I Pks15/1-like n=1 Tax=Asterias rubens TaxID=7604 RepID=UPI0014558ED2|nr:phenolphthiocerol synthesis polyketide synthase type I Pks15/1-like [Asterias rubens]XP_033642000.1 phenolphthiocerol synthesis polyketide synthase type I Pks15/1-like [Asterias rubens]